MEYTRSKHSRLYTTHFPIHGGDYFQGVLSRPEDPLRVAIIISAMNKVPCTSGSRVPGFQPNRCRMLPLDVSIH